MVDEKEDILIVVIAGIGDLVLASKSIRAIRNGFTGAEIHLLTSSDAYPIAVNYPYVDRVWAFPIRELRRQKSSIKSILTLIRQLRKTHFHKIINLYRVDSFFGAVRMGLLFSSLRGRMKVGHNHKGFGFFLNKKSPQSIFHNRHLADGMMDIALLSGGKQDHKGIEVFGSEESERKWKHLLFQGGECKAKIRIGLNPGSDDPAKRWNPAHFSFVADSLMDQYKAEIIILGGPGEEKIAEYIRKTMQKEAVNLAGRLSLNDLIYIITNLDLLISNDSGPMHIAAAVKTPVVAMFGPEKPWRMGPLTKHNMYRAIYKEKEDHDTPYAGKAWKSKSSLARITPQDVLDKSREMLAERDGD